MKALLLREHANGQDTPMTFVARRLLVLGYTGRNEAAVRAHIEELQREGVPPPDRVPLPIPVPARMLSQDPEAEVASAHTSGEVEPVFFIRGKQVWVGVGSDHTDRALERYSIRQSKQVCPKFVGRDVWRLEDLRPVWDEIEMRSFVTERNAEAAPYQRGHLGALLPPERLLEVAREATGLPEPDGLVVFGGTVPLLDGHVRYAPEFSCALHIPGEEHGSACAYRLQVMQPAIDA